MNKTRRKSTSKLSRERLIQAALDLIDTDGVEKLTVRRVAASLDVTPMALYWHFANKDELLDRIGDALAQQIDASVIEVDTHWESRLSALMHHLIDTLGTHPAAAEIAMQRLLYTEQGKRLVEVGLGALREAGLGKEDSFLIGRYALRTAVAVATEPVFTGASVSAERATQLQQEFDTQVEKTLGTFPLLHEMGEATRMASDPHRYREIAVKLFIDGVRHHNSS